MTDIAAWGKSMLERGKSAEGLLAVGVLRICGQKDQAAALFAQAADSAPTAWGALLCNEEAVLAWSAGDLARASTLWATHPQPESPPILFNRGLIGLTAGDRKSANSFFSRVLEKLPDSCAWHHLARLYQTLAAA
jgi:tetratricopeptide (TPR) repeat protein